MKHQIIKQSCQNIFRLAVFMPVLFFCSCEQKHVLKETRRVILIGVDAMTSDGLQQACTPNIDCLKGISMNQAVKPEVISVQKIWDSAPHNAFTDLIRFKGMWYCTFRESTEHVLGTDGKIRVIAGRNGRKWIPVALFERQGVDLRDPKLCITADNRLMLHIGGSVYVNQKHMGYKHAVAFSEDGKNWTKMQDINITDKWPWKPVWNGNTAYVFAYDTAATLFRSNNGIDYEKICSIDLDGYANETALCFLPDDIMFAIIRREKGNRHAYTGTAAPPYDSWTLKETDYFIGGPDIIEISGQLYCAGRCYINDEPKMVLGKINDGNFTPVLVLPSGGDCSYPGMIYYKKVLWMSYYSSHEGHTNIYLAKIRIN